MTQTKKRLGLRVPCDLYKKLASKADLRGQTINALCLEIFWTFFGISDDNQPVPYEIIEEDFPP